MNPEIIDLLKPFLENPWLLTFGAVWGVAFLLKNHSSLKNEFIPWVVVLTGATLGVFLIEKTIGGFIVGALVGLMQIGGYEVVKNTVKLTND